jgi:hypothetical protein
MWQLTDAFSYFFAWFIFVGVGLNYISRIRHR